MRIAVAQRATLARCAFVAGALALALAASTASAQTPKRTVDGSSSDPAALYHNYCSVCHGERGDGRSRAQNSLDPPPRDFTTTASAQELSRPRMLLAVREGRPGTAMTGWKSQLNDRQIEAVVDYVRETFMPSAERARGRDVYAQHCAACHGGGHAVAGAPQALRDFAKAPPIGTRDAMIATVTHGRPGTAMAGFAQRLSAGDIAAAVDYVRSSFTVAASGAHVSGTYAHGVPKGAAARVDMGAPFPRGLVGEARRGRAFYASNCATCHGAKGDGAGPRAYFIRPKPRNFVAEDARARLNRPALFAAVSSGRNGTEMPAWDKVLDAQQIADVSEYVFRSFIVAGRSRAAP